MVKSSIEEGLHLASHIVVALEYEAMKWIFLSCQESAFELSDLLISPGRQGITFVPVSSVSSSVEPGRRGIRASFFKVIPQPVSGLLLTAQLTVLLLI